MANRLCWAALLVFWPAAAAMPEPAAAPSPEPQSMRFEWVQEGPAERCGQNCRSWVAAAGPITTSTLQDFRLFSEVRTLQGATMVLDSGGGSVLASLELGRKIRALGMTTTVGRVLKYQTAPGEEQRGRFSPRGECASMCVFVLLGGAQRTVAPESRILVHQIWPGSKRHDASAETYTAEELVRVQRDVGRIAKYTVEMGAGIELFELAMRIPPWERLRALSQDELRRVGLNTIQTVASAATSGAVDASRPQRTASSAGSERGWSFVESDARQELVRRHPLTVEGDEIGRFELALSCAGKGAYRLAYLESRALADDNPGLRISDIAVRVEDHRTALNIASSAPDRQVGELDTAASAQVTDSFVAKLREDPTNVLVVMTRTSDDTRTLIRVGGTGFARAFSQLSANCK